MRQGQRSGFLVYRCSCGCPQGTKLGPILWLFYVNDLVVPNFNVVKYADDTIFYKASNESAPAILTTQSWSSSNSMTLNTEKTAVVNVRLSNQLHLEEPIVVDNGSSILPANVVKFLGIFIDDRLTFNHHVDKLISRVNYMLHILRHLKTQGLDQNGLRKFYCSNIRPVLTYAAPAWFFLLSGTNKQRLENVQRAATRTILPDIGYEGRLEVLKLPKLQDFIFDTSFRAFQKIANDIKHPLNHRVLVNSARTSSRLKTKYCPTVPRTEKRARFFFSFFMSHCNK